MNDYSKQKDDLSTIEIKFLCSKYIQDCDKAQQKKISNRNSQSCFGGMFVTLVFFGVFMEK